MAALSPYIKRAFSAVLAVWLSPWLALKAAAEGPNNAISARQLYNDGTGQLREGKLRDAENTLEKAVASQDFRVQASALYNLGHVRFRQGEEIRKMKPESQMTEAQTKRAEELGISAVRIVSQALSESDLMTLVAAYQQGQGARKEIKAAINAVKQALETDGSILTKWQRASGDFKSAHELQLPGPEAPANAQIVDAHIAQLIDRQRLSQQRREGLQQTRQELGRKMKELRGKLPKQMAEQMGEPEEDEEKEDKKEPKPGDEEGPRKEQKNRALSPEEAARLLDMLRLDTNRKLSRAGTNAAAIKNQRTW